MFNIGDKLKFNEYYIKNFVSTRQCLTKTLGGERVNKHIREQYADIPRWRLQGFDQIKIWNRETMITTFKRLTIKEDALYDGVYVGEIKRKHKWDYTMTDRPIETEILAEPVGLETRFRLRNVARQPIESSRRDRPSTKSHRIDNPRDLDTIVLLSIQKNRIIGVPINNIIKHNKMDNYKFL